jgi:hypothetical protein
MTPVFMLTEPYPCRYLSSLIYLVENIVKKKKGITAANKHKSIETHTVYIKLSLDLRNYVILHYHHA